MLMTVALRMGCLVLGRLVTRLVMWCLVRPVAPVRGMSAGLVLRVLIPLVVLLMVQTLGLEAWRRLLMWTFL